MSRRLLESTAHAALLAVLAASLASAPALAADIVVGNGTVETDEQAITGTDKLTVEIGGKLDVNGTAVIWETE